MKYFSPVLLCVFYSIATVGPHAQTERQSTPDWENPRVFSIGKEQAHATMTPYPNEAAAASNGRSAWLLSLNGAWKFSWVATPNERPADFYKPEFDVSRWKQIRVPSNWEMEGYGTPIYSNI